MSKHTPGPWHVGNVTGFPSALGVGPRGNTAIATLTLDANGCVQAQEANARLISASPELLAALEDAHRTLLFVDRSKAARIAAVIAKARGET